MVIIGFSQDFCLLITSPSKMTTKYERMKKTLVVAVGVFNRKKRITIKMFKVQLSWQLIFFFIPYYHWLCVFIYWNIKKEN